MKILKKLGNLIIISILFILSIINGVYAGGEDIAQGSTEIVGGTYAPYIVTTGFYRFSVYDGEGKLLLGPKNICPQFTYNEYGKYKEDEMELYLSGEKKLLIKSAPTNKFPWTQTREIDLKQFNLIPSAGCPFFYSEHMTVPDTFPNKKVIGMLMELN